MSEDLSTAVIMRHC